MHRLASVHNRSITRRGRGRHNIPENFRIPSSWGMALGFFVNYTRKGSARRAIRRSTPAGERCARSESLLERRRDAGATQGRKTFWGFQNFG